MDECEEDIENQAVLSEDSQVMLMLPGIQPPIENNQSMGIIFQIIAYILTLFIVMFGTSIREGLISGYNIHIPIYSYAIGIMVIIFINGIVIFKLPINWVALTEIIFIPYLLAQILEEIRSEGIGLWWQLLFLLTVVLCVIVFLVSIRTGVWRSKNSRHFSILTTISIFFSIGQMAMMAVLFWYGDRLFPNGF